MGFAKLAHGNTDRVIRILTMALASLALVSLATAQMIDNTQAPNNAKAGINKSLADEIGAGRGDVMTPGGPGVRGAQFRSRTNQYREVVYG